jgi:hypothetical protein
MKLTSCVGDAWRSLQLISVFGGPRWTVAAPRERLEALEHSRWLASRGREGSNERVVVDQLNGERHAGTPESPRVDRGMAIFGLAVVDRPSMFADVSSFQAELAV